MWEVGGVIVILNREVEVLGVCCARWVRSARTVVVGGRWSIIKA